MLTVIIIIVLFSLLVIIHEWGHFIAARRGGVGVEEFGIGFPPTIWGKVVKGTLYSINWLPLGGFVRLKGEDNAETGPGTFGAAKYWTKFRILLAGVFMNLVTAVVIFFVLCLTGMPALGAKFEPKFLHPSSTQQQLMVTAVIPDSPAAKAGLKQGDFLLKAGSLNLTDPGQLSSFTKSHSGQTATFQVRRDGNERELQVNLRDASNKAGALGVESGQIYKLKYAPFEALIAAIYITGALAWATIIGVLNLFLNIPVLLFYLFSNKVPVAAADASGPVGIFILLRHISVLGYSYVFLLLGNIAVALAAFNVLPLPALDGGRLALITVQKVMKRKISPDLEAKIHAYGFMALLGLVVLMTVYDIRKQ